MKSDSANEPGTEVQTFLIISNSDNLLYVDVHFLNLDVPLHMLIIINKRTTKGTPLCVTRQSRSVLRWCE